MRTHHCPCGETDPDKFYGLKKNVCAVCHNEYTKAKGKESRLKAIGYLGGQCLVCGYEKFSCSLDIHHLSSKTKDPNFGSMRGWSWRRIKKEIQGCALLCKNCHAALHSEEIDHLLVAQLVERVLWEHQDASSSLAE